MEPENIEKVFTNDSEGEKSRKYIFNAAYRENGQRNYISTGLKEAKDEDLILISNYWIKTNKNSYKAISYGFSASVELNKKNVAEDFYNNFVILTSPKSNRDFARILFELQSNKNRKNVIRFIDGLIEDNNSI